MQHSTPTTKSVHRRRIALAVVAALFILGAAAWKFGFALLGLTPIGECTVTSGSETSQISHDEAESLFLAIYGLKHARERKQLNVWV